MHSWTKMPQVTFFLFFTVQEIAPGLGTCQAGAPPLSYTRPDWTAFKLHYKARSHCCLLRVHSGETCQAAGRAPQCQQRGLLLLRSILTSETKKEKRGGRTGGEETCSPALSQPPRRVFARVTAAQGIVASRQLHIRKTPVPPGKDKTFLFFFFFLFKSTYKVKALLQGTRGWSASRCLGTPGLAKFYGASHAVGSGPPLLPHEGLQSGSGRGLCCTEAGAGQAPRRAQGGKHSQQQTPGTPTEGTGALRGANTERSTLAASVAGACRWPALRLVMRHPTGVQDSPPWPPTHMQQSMQRAAGVSLPRLWDGGQGTALREDKRQQRAGQRATGKTA